MQRGLETGMLEDLEDQDWAALLYVLKKAENIFHLSLLMFECGLKMNSSGRTLESLKNIFGLFKRSKV